MLTAAHVVTTGGFKVTDRTPLFDMVPFSQQVNHTPFDIALDDQRFLMVRRLTTGEQGGDYVLVENWFEELRDKVRR